MKIALCISGQPRFVDKGYESTKQFILDKYDVDVFVHTWFDKHNTTEFRNAGGGGYDGMKADDNVDEMIMDLYSPISYHFEPQRIFRTDEIDVVPTLQAWSPNFMHPGGAEYWIDMQRCMWYSIHQANWRKEVYRLDKNVQYDYIIKHRFDLQLRDDIPLPTDNTVCAATTPQDGDPDPLQMRDWCVVGNNQNMNVFSSTFLFIKSMADELPYNLKTNESFSKLLLTKLGIGVTHETFATGIIRP